MSGVHIGNERTLKSRDRVFERKPAFFQSSNAQLVDHGVVRQFVDQVVEIAVIDTQLTESRKLLETLRIDFVTHESLPKETNEQILAQNRSVIAREHRAGRASHDPAARRPGSAG